MVRFQHGEAANQGDVRDGGALQDPARVFHERVHALNCLYRAGLRAVAHDAVEVLRECVLRAPPREGPPPAHHVGVLGQSQPPVPIDCGGSRRRRAATVAA